MKQHANNVPHRYKQDKYNLSREASEGYASLFNDLTTASIDNERDIKGKLVATPLDRIPLFLEIITAHMGEFHLDPNRVLDIILDFFIRQLMVNYNFWVELIKQTDWIEKIKNEQGEISYKPSSNMGQLFGFRFYNYHVSLHQHKRGIDTDALRRWRKLQRPKSCTFPLRFY